MTKPRIALPDKRYIRSADALVQAGLIAPAKKDLIDTVGQRYAISISSELERLIVKTDPADPIALQFVPDARELTVWPHERTDPIGDNAHSPIAGIVHRYPDRVLLTALKVCPVYCRFCFRRETVGPGPGQMLSEPELDAALAYIAGNRAIWEVIFTGGDPLGLSPRRIKALMQRLADVPHVKIVRIHTRVPAVDPARVTAAMVGAIQASGKTVYVALHANHPKEMTEQTCAACAMLIDAGIVMISQTVLLKGVNDNVETLTALMRCFVENRIKPYYLHHPDLAPGTSHFRLPIAQGRALVRQLRGNLSGLALPEYVLDIPGGHGKSPLAESWIKDGGDDTAGARAYAVTDWQGALHRYDDQLNQTGLSDSSSSAETNPASDGTISE